MLSVLEQYREKPAKAVRQAVSSDESIDNIITSLEPELAKPHEPFVRKTAIQFIVDILKKLPRSKLTELQATQLVEFFTKKIINESHLVWSTLLDGLNVIFTRFQDHIGVNEYSLVFSDLLSNIHAQSLSDRTNLFKILHLIVKKHTCILKKLPKNFFLEKYREIF